MPPESGQLLMREIPHAKLLSDLGLQSRQRRRIQRSVNDILGIGPGLGVEASDAADDTGDRAEGLDDLADGLGGAVGGIVRQLIYLAQERQRAME